MLELVDSASLRFVGLNAVNVQVVSRIFLRGYSLIGKTMILRVMVPGSLPGISKFKLEKLNGWAERWNRLGYKFKSYVEQRYISIFF